MADKSWKLCDLAAGVYVNELKLGPAELGGQGSVEKKRLQGGLSDGVDLIEINNGVCSVSILPTRGMSIWRAAAGELKLGWKSPVRGPVHPMFVPLMEPSGLGWLSGFDEFLVRCGLESNGAPDFDEDGRLAYPLHGRIGNLPAHQVEVSAQNDAIVVKGIVEECRFHFLKLRMTSTLTMKFGQAGFTVRDEIENLSAGPAEVQMLYHTNLGYPLLDAGSKLIAPVKTLVPRNAHAAKSIAGWNEYAAEQPGFEEQVYFAELLADEKQQTLAVLKNAHATQGMGLTFNKQQLPCFTLWKNTTAIADGYVTGIEPGTNFPNPRSFEGKQGRVAKIAGGGKFRFDVGFEFYAKEGEVESAVQRVKKLQGDHQPEVFDKPQKGWCADA